MSYSLGTVFLDVAPSFLGVQKAVQRHLRDGFKDMGKEAERNLRETQAAAAKAGDQAGKGYGTAFERTMKPYLKSAQAMLSDLRPREGGKEIAKLRQDLEQISKLDFSKTTGRSGIWDGFQRMRKDVNKLLEEAAAGERRLSADTIRNLGAIRKEAGEVAKVLDAWNRPDPQAAAREKEQRARYKLVAEAERQRALAAERAEQAQRRQINAQIQAEKMMTRELTAREKARRKAAQGPVRDRLRQISEGAQDLKAVKVGVDIDKDQALEEVARLKAMLARVLADAAVVGLDVDAPELIRRAQRAASAAEKAIKEKVVKFEADIDQAARAEVIAKFEQLKRQLAADIKMGVAVDTAAVAAELQGFRSWAEREIEKPLDIRVRSQLSAAIIETKVLERNLRDVGQEAAKAGMLMRLLDAGSAANSVRVFNGYLTTFLALGPLLIPMLAMVAGGIAGVGLAAVSAVLGIGVLVAGLAGIGGAVKALSDLDKARRKADAGAPSKASANAIDPRKAVTDARSIEDAQRSLARAKRAASESIEESNERVAESEQRLGEVMHSASEAQERAAQRQIDAGKALASAQIAARKAQEGVNEARRQATRDLEDMNNQLRSAQLSEKAAQFAVEEAQVHLNVVLEDDQATDREKAVAQLAYDQAAQRLKEQQVETRRLETDTEKANKAGVEGSQRVVDAKDAIVQANERVKDAEQDVLDAATEASKTAADNERRIADAREAVREAEKALAKTRRSAAESVADAERNLARAHEDLNLASKTAATGTNELANELFSVDEAFRGLTPAGRDFAMFLYGLRPLLDDIRAAAQNGLLPGLQESLQLITDTYGPSFVEFVGVMSKVLGDLAVDAAKALTSKEWRSFFSEMSELMPKLLEQVGGITLNIATMLAGVAEAFGPFATEIGEALLGVTEDWAAWAQGLATDAGFQAFLDYLRDAGPELGALFTALGKVFINLLIGLAPYADVLLEITTTFLEWLAAMDPKDLAELVLTVGGLVLAIQLLAGAMAAISGTAKLLTDIIKFGGALKVMMDGIKTFATTFGPKIRATFGPIATVLRTVGAAILTFVGGLSAATIAIVAAVAIVVGAVVWAYLEIDGFRNAVNNFIVGVLNFWRGVYNNAIKPVFDAIGAVVKWIRDEVFTPLGPFFKMLFNQFILPVFVFFRDRVESIFTFIGGIVSVFQQVFSNLGNAISQIVKFIILPVLGFIGSKLSEVWNAYVKPVLGWIGDRFSWLGDKISGIWTNNIKPIFVAFGEFIRDKVAPVFQSGLDLIGSIWDGILDLLRAPVRLFIDVVINKGLIGAFNWLADKVPGMTPLKEVVIPQGLQPGGGKKKGTNPRNNSGGQTTKFADGGVLPGFSPGKDIFKFLGPDGQILELSGGEAILRPELTRALGPEAIHRANAAARSGNPAAGVQALSKRQGGWFDWVTEGWGNVTGWISDTVGNVAGFVKDPIGALENVVESAMSSLGLRDSWMTTLLEKFALAPARSVGKWIGDFIGGGDDKVPDGPRSSSGMGWQAMWDIVKSAFPSASLNSAFRPGAITAVGTPSMHGMGRAIDITPSMAIFEWIKKNFPSSAELIYSPAGDRQLLNGREYRYGEPTRSMHYNHVHWGFKDGGILPTLYDNGGDLPPGMSVVVNKTRKPEAILTNQLVTDLQEQARAVSAGMNVSFDGAHLGYDPNEVAIAIQRRRRDTLALQGLDGSVF